MRVELTESGFADRTATATYGTFTAAETGIEPISSESESDVIPLHYSAIADANGFEPLLIVLETIVLPVTLSIHTRATGLEKIFYPRNPVKRRITTSTPLGYLIGYLKYYMGTSPKKNL